MDSYHAARREGKFAYFNYRMLIVREGQAGGDRRQREVDAEPESPRAVAASPPRHRLPLPLRPHPCKSSLMRCPRVPDCRARSLLAQPPQTPGPSPSRCQVVPRTPQGGRRSARGNRRRFTSHHSKVTEGNDIIDSNL